MRARTLIGTSMGLTMVFMLLEPIPSAAADAQPPSARVEAETVSGSYIICHPRLIVTTSSSGFSWDAYIECGGVPHGRMKALFVDSKATPTQGSALLGPVDGCGAGSVTDFQLQTIDWSRDSCANPSYVSSSQTCSPCSGTWTITGRYGLVFPNLYSITYFTTPACKFEFPNKSYCELTRTIGG